MSYLVMETKRSYAVLLDQEGRFLKAANLHYQVGQTVTDPVLLREKSEKGRLIPLFAGGGAALAAVAACLVFAVILPLYQQATSVYSSIYMTINPQVRMELNKGGDVIGLAPTNPAAQIANMHTLFNIVTTLVLLPLGDYLVKAAMRILPDRPQDQVEGMHLAFLTPISGNPDRAIGLSAIYISQINQELERMLAMARDNLTTAFQAVLERDPSLIPKEEETEDYIDFLNKEISRFISHIIVQETNAQDSATVSACFKITSNIERIGDHAMNICGYSEILKKKDVHFSEEARDEIIQMRDVCQEALDALGKAVADPVSWLTQVSALEQKMDDMTSAFRQNQLERMRRGVCSDEGCILFSEMLTDFERIGDHVLNIAQERSSAPTE